MRVKTPTPRSAAAMLGFAAVTAFAALTACTLVTDVERFKQAQGPAAGRNYDDLRFSIVGMTSHVNEKVELRVIDANNILQMRALVEPLGDVKASFTIPAAIPRVNGPYRFDFFADHNNSGTYDSPPTDHAWRVDPLEDYPPGDATNDPNDGVVTVNYPHNFSFTELAEYKGKAGPPLDTGAPAILKFSGMKEYAGKLLQARVADADTHHVVGQYRITKLTQDAFELTIPGVIDGGVQYSVEVYVDANGNGTYENPAGGGQNTGQTDHGWRIARPSDKKGMTLEFSPTAFVERNIDVGAP